MGLLKILKKIIIPEDKTHSLPDNECETPAEYSQVLAFNSSFKELLSNDKFIARSDYKHLIEEYEHLSNFFKILESSDLLTDYIKKHKLDKDQIIYFSNVYNDIKDIQKESSIIKAHNNKYISRHLVSEKDYLDKILIECDPTISLDDEQREVVLSDEDHTLVIAGAGAGKTTTIAAKVRYLVEKQKISPQKILIISFTNKAVGELRERINDNLHIDCPITTFHSTGYAILKKSDTQNQRIVDSGYMYKVINEYLKSKVLSNSNLVNKLVLFFGSYFSAPYEGDKLNDYFQFISNADFSTLRSDLHEYIQQIISRRDQKALTINNEVLRSFEEVRIANFLYLNNIDYEYEPIYQYRILDANKPYTPDFKIKQGDKCSYIEHFGITESGQSNRYTQEELNKYKSRINDKILLHRSHKTDLIYTFSKYNDHRDYIEHLKDQLLQRGYSIQPRPATEVYKKLADTEENKYIFRLTILICNFISNFKTQGYPFEQFDKFRASTKNIRTDLFLEICSVCYLEYQKALKENHCIDFQDMINESANIIHKRLISQDMLDFKYIIVDEYQDISRQRYNLIKELSQLCHAKIVAVGDDWQSIYAFSGSILPLFTRFSQEVGYAQELKITHTYRNAQEIIDIAGTFIQKNSSQIKKELISPKRISNPVIIRTYSEDTIKGQKGGRYYNLAIEVEKAIENIIEYNNQEIKHRVASILLIGRYGFDARHLCVSSKFTYDEKSGKIYSTKYSNQVKLQFLTAHSSKGLSAENVIIINAKDEIYGFPSKVDDDPVLNLVVSNDQSYNYAEERRLFYVALTRTKNRVFIITPEKRPSEFIKELLRDTKSYPNVTLIGELKASSNGPITIQNRCPICGYPMKFRWNKNYGLRLWICTNDQEICGFMTNDRRGGDLSIQKCDWCEDGFLIVKNGKKGFFLGCTNYRDDKSGCGRMLNPDHYHAWRKNEFGIEDLSATKPSYSKNSQPEMIITSPQMAPTEDIKKRESSSIRPRNTENLVKYTEQFIEKDGFSVVTDPEGKIITDMNLLSKLRSLRHKTALEKNKPAYMIANNDMLVKLATDKPTTAEEFLAIPGIGTKRYKAYGKLFIDAIKEYIINQSGT